MKKWRKRGQWAREAATGQRHSEAKTSKVRGEGTEAPGQDVRHLKEISIYTQREGDGYSHTFPFDHSPSAISTVF
jgi:hypothetical protein